MMHGPIPDQIDRTDPATGNTLVAGLSRALAFSNNIIVVFASIALVAGDRDIEAGTIGVKDLSTGEQVDVATDAVVGELLSRLGR